MQKARTYKYYNHVIVEDLIILYNYDNIMQLPHIKEAIFSISSKSFVLEKRGISMGLAACMLCTGQRGVVTRARKSIAGFKLRKGNLIGCKVRIKRSKVYDMLDKMMTFVYPREEHKQGSTNSKTALTLTQKKHNLMRLHTHLPLCVGVKDMSLLPPIDSFVQHLPLLRGFQVIFLLSFPRLSAARISTLSPELTESTQEATVSVSRPLFRRNEKRDASQDFVLDTHVMQTQHHDMLGLCKIFLSAFQIPSK